MKAVKKYDVEIENRGTIKLHASINAKNVTLDEAVEYIVSANYERMDDAAMIAADKVADMDKDEAAWRAAYQQAWEKTKEELKSGISYDDDNGHIYSIEPAKKYYVVSVRQVYAGTRLTSSPVVVLNDDPISYDVAKDLIAKNESEPYTLANDECSRPELYIVEDLVYDWLEDDDGGKYDWAANGYTDSKYDYSSADCDEDAIAQASFSMDAKYVRDHAVEIEGRYYVEKTVDGEKKLLQPAFATYDEAARRICVLAMNHIEQQADELTSHEGATKAERSRLVSDIKHGILTDGCFTSVAATWKVVEAE